ncbi:MAG: choice-of-anchor D domain-containing protein [Candidatus Sulfotelmatobacter sp.]
MNLKLRVTFVCACLVLSGTLALAATPVTVFPNPIQFGTVPLSSTSSPLVIYLSNTSTSAVTVSGITISGTNSANFAIDGYACVGSISAGQTCEMYLTFTPSAIANFTASLVIAETGVTTAISIPLQGVGGNPIPSITTVSPPTIYIDSPTTTVTINGSGFLSSSTASLASYPSNIQLPTTFVSATQIKTQIPDTVLGSQESISLYVTNPAPGGGTASTSVSVISPEPVISSTSPTSIVAGTASESILINGQNFMSGAKAQWNGTSIATTYLSSTQLQIQPTTAELASAGFVQLSVTNPSPGTISPATSFDLTYPVTVTVLDLPANDIVWDPFAQRIYASMPSSYGPNGNSIAVINPSTGAVTGYFYAGSEPTKLALDSTSKFLYVGLNGDGAIQRLDLPAFTDDILISLGSTTSGPNLAQAIAVSPSNAHTIAVALNEDSCCSSSGPLEFFTDSTKLANSVATPAINQINFASGTTLYGYYPDTLSQVTVSSTGGTLTQQWSNLVDGNTFQYSGGLAFGADGEEFNPATGLLEGTFDVGSICCSSSPQVLPDSAINRAFALGQTPFFSSFGITSYNLSEFTPLAVASLAELAPEYSSTSTSKFIQWGPNGLAFILTGGACCAPFTTQVVLVQSPTLLLTAGKSVNPAPASHSSSPAAVTHGSGNTLLTVHGSGFVPGSVVNWNNKAFSAKYVSASEMTVYVPKAAVASAGTAAVVVKNPTPGGGKSNALTVTIK